MAIKLKELGDVILTALASKKILTAAAISAVESIQKRTRLGKGVTEPEGSASPLPKLAKKTIERRKAEVTKTKETVKKTAAERLEQTLKGKFKKALKGTKSKTKSTNSENVDPQFFSPAKSNLTFTGEMLKSIEYKVQPGEIDIELKDSESKRKATEVLKINPGYEFMNLSKAEINRIEKKMAEELTKILNKIKFTGL